MVKQFVLTDFLVADKQSEISRTFSWSLSKHRQPLGANSGDFSQQKKQSFLICLVQAVLSQLFSPEMVQRADPFTREDRHLTTGQLTLSVTQQMKCQSRHSRSPIVEDVREMGFWQFQGRKQNREKNHFMTIYWQDFS